MRVLSLLSLTLAVVGVTPATAQTAATTNVADGSLTIYQNLGRLNVTVSLYQLLQNINLLDLRNLLNNTSNRYTFLAPSNEALQGVQPLDWNALLRYHILATSALAANLSASYQLESTLLYDTAQAQLPSYQEGQAIVFRPNQTAGAGGVTLTGGSVGTDVSIIQTDLRASNGIIQIIDRVLEIPAKASLVAPRIADITTATALLNQAGLFPRLEQARGLTLFVPNNAALSKLDIILDGATMTPTRPSLNTSQLADLLSFHALVDQTVLYSTRIQDTIQVQTLEEGSLILNRSASNDIYVNNVKVVRADILLANGVMHIIDGVLDPSRAVQKPSGSTAEVASSAGSPAYPQLVVANLLGLVALAVLYL
ncbi:hypothetical protein H4R33_005964 [Dimargaris cristalligena]|uniref:FAS1 domain-containing protein n=1 Tax=Dimargaris cristalligena TaxID=215637 RepID=A0A4P9ZK61_9FUNG|nr:hypothetical protein H4R33_005964 [Dimargaris cristalligena]RKP33465.1 FAS1 domain-containing protein [Dimargaris cristalligena]|eukprot:RKP33465.1 FAS1 domain-containing protein [Dimargaris cristalligena]